MINLNLAKGHPQGLMTLFFSEMWERVCYYGMRVLLTLYLVKSLMKGDADAALIYGAYTGLVYAAPILGGRVADKYLGYRNAVILGAILMALGEFIILGGTEQFLLIGMGALIVGNGYFKANISTIVGKLYKEDDPRRDSGFTIFYIGINIGALIATTLIAYVGETYGFKYGFGLAGFGMLLGLIIFWSGRKNFAAAPGLGITEEGKKTAFLGMNWATVVSIGSLLLIPLCYLLILNNSILNWIFLGLFVLVTFSLISAGIKADKESNLKIWRDRMIALVIFMIINIVFWACFEQAGTSLTLFADRNVDRNIFGWEMPASMTQFFNPFFIISFGSLFSVMWVKLSKIGKNPNIPLKFAFGILQLGLGFLVTYVGYHFAENNLVPILTIVFLYMLHTTGELFLSPIGLSMVTKLSPKNIAGTAMGAWFLSFAIANLLGGQIATLTGGGHGSSEEETTSELQFSSTVENALLAEDRAADYENWDMFYKVPDELNLSGKDKSNVELAKNISYQKYFDIQDWVHFRKSLSKDVTYGEWVADRPIHDTLQTFKEWLNPTAWDQLKSEYKNIIESDFSSDNAGMSLGDWKYYSGNIEGNDYENSAPLSTIITKQKDYVQSTRLDKYVNIFTTIGLILLGFALLVAVFNKPLERLMHGVK